MADNFETDVPDWATHPGLAWLDRAACAGSLLGPEGKVEPGSIRRFFVAAGHVISPEQKEICVECPVRRECLLHAFLGNEGGPIPSGYFAGFSSGQRRSTPFNDLYETVEAESARYRSTTATTTTKAHATAASSAAHTHTERD